MWYRGVPGLHARRRRAQENHRRALQLDWTSPDVRETRDSFSRTKEESAAVRCSGTSRRKGRPRGVQNRIDRLLQHPEEVQNGKGKEGERVARVDESSLVTGAIKKIVVRRIL